MNAKVAFDFDHFPMQCSARVVYCTALASRVLTGVTHTSAGPGCSFADFSEFHRFMTKKGVGAMVSASAGLTMTMTSSGGVLVLGEDTLPGQGDCYI